MKISFCIPETALLIRVSHIRVVIFKMKYVFRVWQGKRRLRKSEVEDRNERSHRHTHTHTWAAMEMSLPRVCHHATVLSWQFLDVDEWKKLLADRARAMANDFHLGERGRRQDGPEEPEDPCHNRGHIYEKLVRLAENVRVSRPRKRWEAHEELGVVALEYARDLRRCRFRVCGAAAEADTLVVYLTGVIQSHAQMLSWRSSPYHELESFDQRFQNQLV